MSKPDGMSQKNITQKAMLFISIAFLFSSASPLWAWGPRGHFTICEIAVDLVKNEELRDFLKPRRVMLGYLCNVPDMIWKPLDYEFTSVGNPGHYLNPEHIGQSLETLSSDYAGIAKSLKTTTFELNMLLGSLWWRGDQFYRRALNAAKEISKAEEKEIKSSKKKRKSKNSNELSPSMTKIYEMMTNMGIMGHFLGDASMPYHSSANFDGWVNGRGGIHGYYEAQVVDELEAGFQSQVAARASEIKLPVVKDEKNYAIERLRTLSILAKAEMPTIEKIDVVFEPSSKEEGDRQTKMRNSKNKERPKNAKRPSPREQAKKFQPIIVDEFARSALATAELWDRIYSEAGKPSLKGYSSYKFPYAPDFVMPDYTE